MISLENIHKRFGSNHVLKEINGEIEKGEIFSVIGPSGGGKSTILRIINLLEEPSEGRVLFDGIDIHAESTDRLSVIRRMGMVFQEAAVFDGTVFDNIALGLKYRGVSGSKSESIILHSLEEIGLSGFENRIASTLSGGEMQRVALARVMVSGPDLLLLDEPTSSLDPVNTAMIESLIKYYNETYDTTVIISTHDMMQGQRISDRMGVLIEGRFSQIGTPREVFSTPQTSMVARFVGMGNVFTGKVLSNDNHVSKTVTSDVEIFSSLLLAPGTSVSICFRAEDVVIFKNGPPEKSSFQNILKGVVTEVTATGPVNSITIDCGIDIVSHITWKASEELGLLKGNEVYIAFKAAVVHLIDETI